MGLPPPPDLTLTCSPVRVLGALCSGPRLGARCKAAHDLGAPSLKACGHGHLMRVLGLKAALTLTHRLC